MAQPKYASLEDLTFIPIEDRGIIEVKAAVVSTPRARGEKARIMGGIWQACLPDLRPKLQTALENQSKPGQLDENTLITGGL